jgi:SAM-dependent methyltransferase
MLGHDRPTELRRLRLRERLMDPESKRLLRARKLERGWRCLELGAGTGSLARWLARRCVEGHVVATDLDVRHLQRLRAPNLEVVRHDVVGDDFPAGSFDLVHARSLLVNVPEREEVLANIVGWLAPGGWLVLEEPAFLLHDASPHPAFRRLFDAFEAALRRSHGADVRWAPRLPALFSAHGLDDVGIDVTSQLVGDGGPAEAIWRTAFAQARDQLLSLELISEQDLDSGLALFDEPQFLDGAMLMIAAWGRRAREA